MLTRLLFLVALAACVYGSDVIEEGEDRDGKLLPLLRIVKFNNTDCLASTGESGTCYTPGQCTALGGIASGSCALTYGVCCIKYATCDSTITVNGTYFTNPGYPLPYSTAGICTATIVPPPGTCQILLTFDHFELGGPVDGTCGNDTFTVTGNDPTPAVPTLCGSNTGQHLYFGTCQSGGPFKLSALLSALAANRKWKIKVTFIERGHPCPAPGKCLQFFKTVSGTIKSFNYIAGLATNQMLNNLASVTSDPFFAGWGCAAAAQSAASTLVLSHWTASAYTICFADLPGLCDINMSFGELSLGNTLGACGGDYIALTGIKFCGDTNTLTAVANATGPIGTTVVTDDTNDFQDKGFIADYMMLPCQ
ncbi:uncharacterized protein LOC143028854 [Oratosquilla oratoria]|uniref:uncharacterized protein LOC143028854 n=1 Tax=Oratosquilla oratoria TaxID=337810 RepID=UPI003F76426A